MLKTLKSNLLLTPSVTKSFATDWYVGVRLTSSLPGVGKPSALVLGAACTFRNRLDYVSKFGELSMSLH